MFLLFFPACSLALSIHNFTISVIMPTFPLCIEGVINAMKLLGEASLAMINSMRFLAYILFNFINVANWRLFSVTAIFHFFDRWPIFQCAELCECIMYFCCYFFVVHGFFLSIAHMMHTRIFFFIVLSPLSRCIVVPCIFVFSVFCIFLFLFLIFLS
jgi:hypothetical protein